jgi:hypothetical protein
MNCAQAVMVLVNIKKGRENADDEKLLVQQAQ